MKSPRDSVRFKPRFTDKAIVVKERKEITFGLSSGEVDKVVKDLSKNEMLMSLMYEFIEKARKIDSMSPEEEILAANNISKYFISYLKENSYEDRYQTFVLHLKEEMFQRIEDGEIENEFG